MTQDEELEKLKAEAESLGIDVNNLNDEPSSNFESPSPTVKDSVYKFFREILTTKDTTRFGNLDQKELGSVRMGVRHYQSIGNFADEMELGTVGNYLRKESEIITSTSMSKKGWFGNLTVTQIKKEQKIKSPEIQKSGLFGFKRAEVQDE